jgi:hypothetical protein
MTQPARRPHRAAGNPPQDITDPVTGGSRLLSQRCATCILRPGDPMHLGPSRLRAVITGALTAGTYVVCHDTLTCGDFPDYGPAICRGFFDAYARQSPALLLLQACNRLTEVPPPGSGLPAPRDSGRAECPGSPRAGSRPPGTPAPDGGDPDSQASAAEAPHDKMRPSSGRYQIVRELLAQRYGPAVPVTDAMVRAVLDGLGREARDKDTAPRASGAPGGAAEEPPEPPEPAP